MIAYEGVEPVEHRHVHVHDVSASATRQMVMWLEAGVVTITAVAEVKCVEALLLDQYVEVAIDRSHGQTRMVRSQAGVDLLSRQVSPTIPDETKDRFPVRRSMIPGHVGCHSSSVLTSMFQQLM